MWVEIAAPLTHDTEIERNGREKGTSSVMVRRRRRQLVQCRSAKVAAEKLKRERDWGRRE
ncbi:hypothetical protein JCGZ_23250 [Jatropha curcas]|uniref:Uncharacterized protein n=1 Tax=Jatropha curcas TaxID=180498 RepID=A0A067JHS2_JATCU|nr:hypothetical protein JCGZ_23250 [Jatropha curcas]